MKQTGFIAPVITEDQYRNYKLNNLCVTCGILTKGMSKKAMCKSCSVTGYLHTSDTKKKMSEAKKGKPSPYKNKPGLKGFKSPHWKGGLMNCKECDKQLSFYKSKTGLCRNCNNRINPSASKGGLMNIPGYHSFIEKRRVLRKKGNGGCHTIIEWEELKKKFGYMCLCCKRYEPEIKLTEDHISPVSKGGTDDIQNIQPLCQSCNSRKHAKYIDFISLIEIRR